jgi:pyruvate,orthophosphate dikinase
MTVPISSYQIRSHYPNEYLYFSNMTGDFGVKTPLVGAKEPEIDFTLDRVGRSRSMTIREVDLYYLNHLDEGEAESYLWNLIQALDGIDLARRRVQKAIAPFIREKYQYYRKMSLFENRYVVPGNTGRSYAPGLVSHKGARLIELIRNGYPVPPLSIITSDAYHLDLPKIREVMEEGVSNLEKMTSCRLGSSDSPLLIAVRSALPKYIPGLMPTYLNIGVTENAYAALVAEYGEPVANKIYLNNLKHLSQFFPRDAGHRQMGEISSCSTDEEIRQSIDYFKDWIRKHHRSILTDAHEQLYFCMEQILKFYRDKQDLLFTFTKDTCSFPSFILQKMVCTVRGDASYAGVLYSRHSRTGLGRQVESIHAAFGEEIMTGTQIADDMEFFQNNEIKESFPAVYHFSPLLDSLEERFRSPVTVEFASEYGNHRHLFALLQLNLSEMTGRATLLSALDLFHRDIIGKERLTELVKPYHLKQIISDTIDPTSFKKLKFFSRGFSILPRTAVTAQLFFSAASALEAKRRGQKVCFCKETFLPEDTVVLREMDAILSLTPAAIHVVTACRGYGMPAFLNLEDFGVRLTASRQLINGEGMVFNEGDWITISSRRKTIYKGIAAFQPARFQKYLDGEPLKMTLKEKRVFENLSRAYRQYQRLVQSLEASQINSLNSLIKIIRNDYPRDTQKATRIVNQWFDSNTGEYARELLKSELGTHMEQHRIYNLLSDERKILLFKYVIPLCEKEKLKGFLAGSFMLGRFMCNPHRVAFWSELSDDHVAFLLNEWILFEKYMEVLNEIGEQQIKRIRQRIISGQTRSTRIILNQAKVEHFIQLKLSCRRLESIHSALNHGSDPQTFDLLLMLKEPYGYFYDYKKKWSLSKLQSICDEEGLPLPAETER